MLCGQVRQYVSLAAGTVRALTFRLCGHVRPYASICNVRQPDTSYVDPAAGTLTLNLLQMPVLLLMPWSMMWSELWTVPVLQAQCSL